MEEKEFQIYLQERELLPHRINIFLITNSILFIGYVQIRFHHLGGIIAVLGVVSCILALCHFRWLDQRLRNFEGQLDEQLKEKLEITGETKRCRIRGRGMLWVYPLFFLIIWALSISFSFGCDWLFESCI